MFLNLFCFKVWLNRGEVRDGALATFEAASHSWESQAGSCQGGDDTAAQLADCRHSTAF